MLIDKKSYGLFVIDRSEAAIVNTSSIFGMIAVPGQSVYHATKFAVRGFTESLALEMATTNPNLQVHCVHPGHIGTNIAASARMDEKEFNKQLSKMDFTDTEKEFISDYYEELKQLVEHNFEFGISMFLFG